MAENEIRILDLPVRQELNDEDYLASDRPSGTARVSARVIKELAREAAGEASAGTDVKKYLTNCITETENGAIRYVLGTKANYTIVGEPILQNGVLTGGTAADYVTVTAGPKIVQKSLFVQVKIHTPAAHSSTVGSLFGGTGGGLGFAVNIASGVVKLYLSTNGTSWNLSSDVSTNKVLPTDADVWLRLTWNGKMYAFAWSADGVKFTTSWVLASAVGLNFGTTGILQIGKPYTGACDLNEYALNIDGEMVYGGANFLACNGTASEAGPSVVGGKASGFAANKYVLLPQTAKSAIKSLDVTVKWTTAATLTKWQNVLSLITQYGIVVHTNSNGHIHIWCGTGSAWEVSEFDTQLVVEPSKTYWFKLFWDGETVTPMLSVDGVNFVAGRGFEKRTAFGWNDVCLGREFVGGGNLQQGSYDLSGCVMRVDGDVVYDGANVINGGATLENGVLSDFGQYKTAMASKFVPTSEDHYIYQIKFHTPESWPSRTQYLVGAEKRPDGYVGGFLLSVNSSGKLLVYNDSASYTSNWNIMSGYEQKSDKAEWVLPTDADVWFRLVRVAKLGYLPQISFDGVNFKSGRFLASTAATGAQRKEFGLQHYGNTEFYLGTADLKATFFKNDGEYVFNGANLITVNEAQIANGIVSGASASVYSGAFYPERTPNAAATSWDVLFNFTTTEHTTRTQDIIGNFINNYPKVMVESSKLVFYPDNTRRITSPDSALLAAGTKYWARVTWDGAKYEMYHLADDGTYTKDTLPALSEWTKDGEWASSTDWYKDILFNFCHSRQYPAETFTGSVHLDGCKFVRNGITFWEWNGKNGDNFDLNHKTGWTYNGGDYVAPRVSALSWAWNGKDAPNTAMEGGKIWELVKEFVGAIYERAGVRALVKQGVNPDGSVKNLHHTCQQDTPVPIPAAQAGNFVAYIDENGDLQAAEETSPDLPANRADLARFVMEDYIVKSVVANKVFVLQEDTKAETLAALSRFAPDYSAGIALATGDFTAPTNGVICCVSKNGYPSVTISFEGKVLQGTSCGDSGGTWESAMVIAEAGETYSLWFNNSGTFYPFVIK